MRIAFLTPEYVSDFPDSGGLASYVARMAAALRALGHEPEVFTLGNQNHVFEHEGIRVEQAQPSENFKLKMLSSHWRSRLRFSGTIKHLRGALALGQALERREKQAAFGIVQSSDYGLCGAYVPRRAGRTHLVRCSWSRRLYQQYAAADDSMDWRTISRFERRCVRRADVAYAPSDYIADDLSRSFNVPVLTLRPPLLPRPSGNLAHPDPLPQRYMIHFGQLSPIKGTDLLAEALPIVWRSEPTFTMVWAGRQQSPAFVDKLAATWGTNIQRVNWTGPLPRRQLYAALTHAEAAVLPSRCDNLPNSVIESLSLGVPVIGSKGASIDELVEDGATGKLVQIANAPALAEAMIDLWRNPMTVSQDALQHHGVWMQMQPQIAARGLVDLAGKRNAQDRCIPAAQHAA